jgi:Putative polyhydroxyalkanoic acid system protein (PHA_gran_rgn)
MPGLTVNVGHLLSQDEALRRIQAMISRFTAQYSGTVDVQQGWDGYVGMFKVSGFGQNAPATVSVSPSEVTVQVQLSILASAFRSRIEDTIRDVVGRAVA